MAVEKKFTCNLCGCALREFNIDGYETAVPGWGLRSDGTHPAWHKTSLDDAYIHVCAVCGPAIGAAFAPDVPRPVAEAHARGLIDSGTQVQNAVHRRHVAEASK